MNLYSYALAFIFTCILLSCNSKKSNTVLVQITKISDHIGTDFDSVKISHEPIMEYEYLARTTLDSTNKVSIDFELEKPILGSIQIGNSYSQVFLRPGDQLNIQLSIKEKKSTFIFNNDDSDNNIGHINNYLRETADVIGKASKNSFLGKDVEQFLQSFDSISLCIEKYHKDFLDSIPLKEEEVDLISKINTLKLLETKLWYTFRRHNDFLVDQIYAFRDGKEMEKYVQPEKLNNIMNEVPFDTSLLKSEIYSKIYKEILWLFSEEKFKNPIFNPALWDKPNPNNPKLTTDAIKREDFPSAMKEYMQASNLRSYMYTSGITEAIDSLYTSFTNEFPKSKFTSALQNTYDQQVAILPGNIAPNFTGKSVEGRIVNLHDFKGRVVYVDVWATWCGPCVEEIPYAIELHKAFEGNDQVIFLNVSVDKDVDAWRSKLEKEKDWKGVHINLSKAQIDSLGINYRVVGYPQYFIIDKDGRIITAKAPRPSSNDVLKGEIQRLTDKKASM